MQNNKDDPRKIPPLSRWGDYSTGQHSGTRTAAARMRKAPRTGAERKTEW